jgi:HAD superfamily hydrolase (TIGR01509 family)
MGKQNQFRALVWDLGGVILRTEDLSFRERWERRFGLEPWGLEKLIFRSKMSKLASIGKASTEDIWNSVQEKLGLTNSELEQLRVDFFAGDRIDEELLAFIRRLKGQVKIGMITNAWPDIRPWMEEQAGIADAFDHIVISSEVGMVKPQKEIYWLSLSGLDVAAEEALFIDDFVENIEGAEAVGMHAIPLRDLDNSLYIFPLIFNGELHSILSS